MTAKKSTLFKTFSLALIFTAAGNLWSQPSDQELERTVQDADDTFVPLSDLKPLDVDKKTVNKHILDFGLSTSSGMYIDSTLNNNLFLGFYRPYLRYLLDEKHEFTLKGKVGVKGWQKQPTTGDRWKATGSLEVANANLTFGFHNVEIGRRYFKLGKGIMFANFADGMKYEYDHRLFYAKAIGMYSGDYGSNCTVSIQGCGGGSNPFDVVPNRKIDEKVVDPGRKAFAGTELGSPMFFGNRFYIAGLYVKDMINEDKSTTKTAYNPYYAAAGMKGYLFTPSLRYGTEGIYQGGKTYNQASSGVTEQVDVSAMAFSFDIKWGMPWFTDILDPTLMGQYAYATGDSDKSNVTSPVNTNTAGKDQAFYNFGTYSAGMALKPSMANLQIIRAGFSLKPLKKFYFFRKVGTVFFYNMYRKVLSNGAISDSKAVGVTESNGKFTSTGKPIDDANVGQGFDATLIWDFSSDVKLFYAFGIFLPGSAYPNKDTSGNDGKAARTVHFINVTLNF